MLSHLYSKENTSFYQPQLIHYAEALFINPCSKICDHFLGTQIIIKRFTFFFTQYKNEQKEYKFWRQKD